MIDLNEALMVMETAAVKAGHILLEMQPQSRRLESRKDFLTDADLESEEVILHTLSSKYPDIPSFSEEKGGKETREGYLWVIDPVDGTINFFLGDDHWGISIALVENGRTMAGVIYLPARKQLFSASRNIASRLRYFDGQESEWKNLKVNEESNPANSQFWLAWGKEEHGGSDHKKVYDVIKRLDCHSLYPQIRNAASADIMTVALGRIAGHVFPKPDPFDIAAAGLIVEQAGGTVTDMDGKEWSPFSRSLVASNGVIHSELLRILK